MRYPRGLFKNRRHLSTFLWNHRYALQLTRFIYCTSMVIILFSFQYLPGIFASRAPSAGGSAQHTCTVTPFGEKLGVPRDDSCTAVSLAPPGGHTTGLVLWRHRWCSHKAEPAERPSCWLLRSCCFQCPLMHHNTGHLVLEFPENDGPSRQLKAGIP